MDVSRCQSHRLPFYKRSIRGQKMGFCRRCRTFLCYIQ
nr:MAG TPA: putative membrane protein [Caudoviricetes sp.]